MKKCTDFLIGKWEHIIHIKNITNTSKLKQAFLETDLSVFHHDELSHDMGEIHTIHPVENLKYKTWQLDGAPHSYCECAF